MEMFQAAADGAVKALWIVCTNPAQSLPDQAMVRRALERAEFVIVQEAFATTATCAYADLLLPATTWGEKDGTVTNSERRISRVRPPCRAGQARHDWAIATDLARRLAARRARAHRPLPLHHARVHLERAPRQHPRPRPGHHRPELRPAGGAGPAAMALPEGAEGRSRLYADGVFHRRRPGPLADVTPRPLAEVPDAEYPFSLLTGRLRDQWHGMSRTGLGRLYGHEGLPAIDLAPADLARLGLRDGDLVRVAGAPSCCRPAPARACSPARPSCPCTGARRCSAARTTRASR
jgi:assimilatory nitrate reductase catalytic subunit